MDQSHVRPLAVRCAFALAVASSLLAALLALASCGSAPEGLTPTPLPEPTWPPPGTLRGSVSFSGQMLEGGLLLVQLYRGPAGSVISTTQLSSQGGEYSFPGLIQSDYYVRVYLNRSGHPGAPLPYDLISWYDPDGDGQPNPIPVPAGGVGDGGTIALYDEAAATAQGTVYGTVTYTGVQSSEHWLTVRAVPEDRAYPLVVGETSCLGCLGAYTLPVRSQRFNVEAWFDVNDDGLLDIDDPSACYVGAGQAGCWTADPAKDRGVDTGFDITLNDPAPRGHSVLGPVGGPTFAGGQVLALVPRVDVSGTVYAVTGMTSEGLGYTTANAHIRRTTDGGVTWRTLFTTINYLRGLAVLSNTLLAVGDGGWDQDLIVMSTDNGLYWTTVFTSTWTAAGPYGLRAAAILPGKPPVLFAAGWQSDMPMTCWAGVILRSTDGGTKWGQAFKTQLACDWSFASEFLALAIAPHQDQTMFVAGAQTLQGKSTAVLYRTDDRGDHWTLAYSTTLASAFTTMVFDPLTPTIVYLGGEPSLGNSPRARRDQWDPWEGRDVGVLFRSADGGRTWALVCDESGLFVALQPDLLYASTSTTVRRADSTITPSHWLTGTALPASAGPLRSLVADPFVPGKLYAGTYSGGVYVSLDGGPSWVSQSRGMRTMVRPVDIVADPVDRHKLFVAAGRNGGFLSRDDGATWTQLSGAPEWYSFAVDPTNPQVALAGVGGVNAPSILRSSDGGRTWSAVFTVPAIQAGKGGGPTRFPALTFSPSDPQVAYAGGWESLAGGSRTHLLASSDGGRTWFSLQEPRAGGYGVTRLAVHPTRSEVLFVAGNDPGTDDQEHGVVWRSIDGGQTWEILVRHDQPGPNSTFTDVVIDPHNPEVVYAASGSEVLKSADGGETWQVLRNRKGELGAVLALDPLHPQLVYSAAAFLYESTDGGATWDILPMPNYFYFETEIYPAALTVINRNGVQGIYVGKIGVYIGERPDPAKQ
jgi:photosystem II stability/assembly factor-like uncharacterized protein